MRRIEMVQRHLSDAPNQAGGESGIHAERTGARPTSTPQVGDAYDYIVVGGGSAGCVLASRLSEDLNVSVLLLEAGGSNQNFRVRWPMITCPTLQNSKMDWAFRTAPQPHTAHRVSYQPRGKLLGGCSSINYMIACRGDPRNYDQWAREYGCEGWSYSELLPYFKKSENLSVSRHHRSRLDYEVRGKGGPLDITDASDPALEYSARTSVNKFIKGCEEMGIPRNEDYNGRVQEGAGPIQVTVKDGKRRDTASTFLFETGALERGNLTVATFAHVMQVVLQGDQAIGVTFKQGDFDLETLSGDSVPSRFVRAKKEVILCAGAYGTPQILMLSGVGPRKHLEEMNISVHADLPGVGSNLQDHLMVPIAYPTRAGVDHPSFRVVDVVKELINFLFFSSGIFMLPFIVAVAFFQSGFRKEEDGNDLQIQFLPYVTNDKEELRVNFGFDEKVNPRYSAILESPKGIVFFPALVRPKSVGTVRLQSNNPFQHPLIDPCYLSEQSDMSALLACYKKCRDIAENSSAFRDYLGPMRVNPFSKYHPDSDEYMMEHIREEAVTIYHPTSTCRMGQLDDPMVVVDAKTLKVKGFRNLRVADCSVCPQVVSGNTNLIAIAIAEKAADLISSPYLLR